YMGRTRASWPQRVGAYLIDYLIAAIPAFLAVLLFSGTSSDSNPGAGAGLVAFLLYLVSLGIWIYNRAILMGRTGQSWGKQVLNLRLVRMAEGRPVVSEGGAGKARVDAHRRPGHGHGRAGHRRQAVRAGPRGGGRHPRPGRDPGPAGAGPLRQPAVPGLAGRAPAGAAGGLGRGGRPRRAGRERHRRRRLLGGAAAGRRGQPRRQGPGRRG